MALKLIYIVCSCGATVDMVEYDDAATSRAVSDVMAALDVDEARARELVGTNNPGAELTGEENARMLADQIRTRSVPDRDKDTYTCGNGHYDKPLAITDQRPAPAAVSLQKVPAEVADRLADLDRQAREAGGTSE